MSEYIRTGSGRTYNAKDAISAYPEEPSDTPNIKSLPQIETIFVHTSTSVRPSEWTSPVVPVTPAHEG